MWQADLTFVTCTKIVHFHISSSRNFVLNFDCKKAFDMIINLGDQNSLVNEYLRELRDKNLQKDRARFRNNMERLGQIMAYEISKRMMYRPDTIQTPLGNSMLNLLVAKPVLITVLRAGLPYFHGFLNYFDQSDCGFIGAYRDERGNDSITINLEYLATSSLAGKELILIDPMLATGKSVVKALQSLVQAGNPAMIHLASLVAAPEGLKYIQDNVKLPFTLWTFAIDERLNDRSYIVPGLGDAGDLSYGSKL
jgi:uracil phosphoribosyltransferase